MMEVVSQPIKSPNHFEKDLGHLNDEKKQRVIALLHVFMNDIRGLYDQATELLQSTMNKCEESCDSCAFVRSTDEWKGFAATSYGLLWVIYNDKFFVCHRNQPTWKENEIRLDNLVPCMGWIYVKALNPDEVKRVARSTMEAIRKIADRH